MGYFARKQEEGDQRRLQVLTSLLVPGETLIGSVFGNEQHAMKANLYIIGVTNFRLVFVPIDRKMNPDGEPITVPAHLIENSSVWGWGGGLKEFLAMNSNEQIRIETATHKWKFMITGGNWFENKIAGEGQVRGIDSLVEFLMAAKAARGA